MSAAKNKDFSSIPLSVLDLATIREGHTAADAFRNSLKLAQGTEKAGYKRYWFAEHHNMESVASSSPGILIGYIAGGTSSIRVGSGGIMLPNHAPLIIAEQFGTLASLYPNRIDLGLGRAPGTDQVTAMALRRNRMESVHDFPQDVLQLQTLFSAENRTARVRAIPGEGLEVPIWILGSSTDSARLAASLGLPYAFASHFAPTYLHHALQLYREGFLPSESLQAPHTMACVNVIVADTDAKAQKLATSFYNLALGLIRNNRKPLQAPVDSMEGLWTDYEKAAVQQMMAYSFVGSPETVKESLEDFLAQTGVDELMVAAHIYDPAAKLRSYELLAGLQKSGDY
ncbi:MAG: class flavin-dependent oxidoreductase [Flaviaesturariibacter sp.]|nr:class flavin-dependent oxidoreductase [Flaviaesturariibacter sp.]